MDKLDATEEREGGVRGVGEGFPGYWREDLFVFRPDEREIAKRETVFETWVAAASAAAK